MSLGGGKPSAGGRAVQAAGGEPFCHGDTDAGWSWGGCCLSAAYQYWRFVGAGREHTCARDRDRFLLSSVCFLGFIASQNHLGWKRPLRSLSPTVNLTLPSPPLHHVPKCHIHTSFEYPQGWFAAGQAGERAGRVQRRELKPVRLEVRVTARGIPVLCRDATSAKGFGGKWSRVLQEGSLIPVHLCW